jgi:hypothetical protein
VKLNGGLVAAICAGAVSVGGCVTPVLDHPAWYCTGTARIGDVEADSTANLNADGKVFQTIRNWREDPTIGALKISVGSWKDGEVSVGIFQPEDFDRHVYRVEIRLESFDRPQLDPALGRDNLRRGNVYTFLQADLSKIANHRAFFVALDKDGRVWRAVPLDLSSIERGARAMSLADIELSKMRESFSTKCVRRTDATDSAVIT